jgi:acetate kinase
VERIGLKDAFLEWSVGSEEKRTDWPGGVPDHEKALAEVFRALDFSGLPVKEIAAVGHRVVHGGEEFTAPTVVTAKVELKLADYNRLAPLHNPANLAGIAACRRLLPKAKQVACFDTAFYRTLPDFAYMYALPWEYYRKHQIRKYGFHGISHDYVTREAARRLKRPLSKLRLVSCHLGSGSSVTAIKFGKAVETTMGFTPLEGLTMSTRCGDIDPAIPLYLIRELRLTPGEVDDVMNRQSGLLGISGYKDMRDVMSAAGLKVAGYRFKDKVSAAVKKRAKLAYEMYCYDVARYLASFAGLMGGCDAVIFTAGVGERNATIRKKIMSMVKLPGNPKALVVPTDEELLIAQETAKATR